LQRRPGVNILSIQSWVAYGHVGNAAAVFALQRLGVEVWAINTVLSAVFHTLLRLRRAQPRDPDIGQRRGRAVRCIAGLALAAGWASYLHRVEVILG
jgi:hypothetical protein